MQVINQYAVEGGAGAQAENAAAHANRYDVTILVNGLPLVHLELKRRGVEIRQAFNQINRYQRDSFWAGAGLYEYVQVFIISNGTNTKYYSNTTRASHIREMDAAGRRASKKTSNSFEFTSFWADASNRLITDLMDFGRTFLAKHTLLAVLTRYSIFTTEEVLMLMRPYQIAATERILSRIKIASNYKTWGKIEGGGYIWHTTGSGKTLTSFKTAQLAAGLSDIDKVLFVVDRKDLDYQTMKEYDRFEKGAANGNTSTRVLAGQLANDAARIVVTTIQKLAMFIKQNKTHAIYGKHVVLIFDECHRSQFGDMHTAIAKAFKKYHIFGFTGTPIFAPNASGAGKPSARTTPQLFGDKLHTYTIVNAINDGNVLPFRIDYINTMKSKAEIEDKEVRAIDRESVVLLRGFRDYYDGYDDASGRHHKGYAELILELREKFAVGEPILGEQAQKDFVRIFGSILRLRNILTAFDDFEESDPLLPPRDLQDYQSMYLDIHREMTDAGNAEKENINDDVVFELELIRQVDVNIDYILLLVEKYHASNGLDKSIIGAIDRAVGASPELRSKKELIDGFIKTVNTNTKVMEDWRTYVDAEKEKALEKIVQEEKLKPEETEKFVRSALRDGRFKTTGTAIDTILPPVHRFDGARAEKKAGVIEKLKAFFATFMGLVEE